MERFLLPRGKLTTNLVDAVADGVEVVEVVVTELFKIGKGAEELDRLDWLDTGGVNVADPVVAEAVPVVVPLLVQVDASWTPIVTGEQPTGKVLLNKASTVPLSYVQKYAWP